MSIVISAQSTPALENTVNGFGAGQVEVVVSLSAPAADDITVQYRLRDGSARDDDLLYLSTWFRNFGTLHFAAGETEKTITIETKPDGLAEPVEGFAIELFNPVGATLDGGGPLLQTLGLILDDDGPTALVPEVFVNAPTQIAGLPQTLVQFEVHLSEPATSEMTFNYQLTGHVGLPMTGQITFETGQRVATIDLMLPTSALSEGLNTLGMQLTSDMSGLAPVFGAANILRPTEGDLPTLAVLGDVGLENVGPVDGRLGFTIILSEPSPDPVRIEYFLSGASANDLDLNAPFAAGSNQGTVVFAPGQTVGTIQVALQTDSTLEADEAFYLHLVNPEGARFASDAVELKALGVVLDNDAFDTAPSLLMTDAVLKQGAVGSFAEFTLSLSRPLSEEAWITFSTQDGTAMAGSSYDAMTGQIQLAAGQTTAQVRVPVEDARGVFSLEATLGSQTLLDQPVRTAQAWLTAPDDALPATVSARGLDVVWTQGQDTTARFVVSLDRPVETAVTVSFKLSAQGTFDPTLDGLFASSGTVSFAPGQTTSVLQIDLDTAADLARDSGLWLELFDPAGAALDSTMIGGHALSVLRTTTNAGEAPRLLITKAALQNGSEDSFALLELRLSRPAEAVTEVRYNSVDGSAIAGTDYDATVGSIVFETGQQSAYLRVPIVPQAFDASGSQFMISAQITGSQDVVWTTIDLPPTDTPDGPVISVTGTAIFENQGLGSNELPFEIALTSPSTEVVSVRYEAFFGTSQADDLASPVLSGDVEFQPGETRQFVTIATQFDTLPETDETLFLRLMHPSFAEFGNGRDAITAVGFILDDDGDAFPSIAASETQIIEGGTAQIAVHLSRPLLQDATFSVSPLFESASNTDLVLHDTALTFLAGQTTAFLSISALDDGIQESVETLQLAISQIGGIDEMPMQTNASVQIIERPAEGSDAPTTQSGSGFGDVLLGGGASDILLGLGGDDQLFGAGGDDFILPGTGNDWISGGSGTDTISFVDAVQGVAVDMIQSDAVSGADTDSWTGIENITASTHADFILTDDGNNRIRTLGNFDWIVGSDGFDFIDGGDGRDMLSYVYAPGSVVVDLGLGRGLGGQAEGDRFVNIERLTGSVFSDRFLGSDGQDDFRGLGGDDWFVASDGGRDRYDGGTGRDTVAYSLAPDSVTASLTTGIFGEGQAALDLFTSIENLTGSSFDDLLIGEAGRNTLRGLYGKDVLEGRGGNDHLIGGALDDVLDGGRGWDVAVFDANRADYRIEQFGTSFQVTALGSTNEGTDTLIDIEAIQFADTLVFL